MAANTNDTKNPIVIISFPESAHIIYVCVCVIRLIGVKDKNPALPLILITTWPSLPGTDIELFSIYHKCLCDFAPNPTIIEEETSKYTTKGNFWNSIDLEVFDAIIIFCCFAMIGRAES